MLDELLRGFLGGGPAGPGYGPEPPGEQKSLLPLIIIGFIIIGGLKWLKGKEIL